MKKGKKKRSQFNPGNNKWRIYKFLFGGWASEIHTGPVKMEKKMLCWTLPCNWMWLFAILQARQMFWEGLLPTGIQNSQKQRNVHLWILWPMMWCSYWRGGGLDVITTCNFLLSNSKHRVRTRQSSEQNTFFIFQHKPWWTETVLSFERKGWFSRQIKTWC